MGILQYQQEAVRGAGAWKEGEAVQKICPDEGCVLPWAYLRARR